MKSSSKVIEKLFSKTSSPTLALALQTHFVWTGGYRILEKRYLIYIELENAISIVYRIYIMKNI